MQHQIERKREKKHESERHTIQEVYHLNANSQKLIDRLSNFQQNGTMYKILNEALDMVTKKSMWHKNYFHRLDDRIKNSH